MLACVYVYVYVYATVCFPPAMAFKKNRPAAGVARVFLVQRRVHTSFEFRFSVFGFGFRLQASFPAITIYVGPAPPPSFPSPPPLDPSSPAPPPHMLERDCGAVESADLS